MYTGWLAMEHYRLHLMEQWRDGPVKEAGLAAARWALAGLERSVPARTRFVCNVCATRRGSNVIEYSPPPNVSRMAA